ncbi:MAG: hypothetical protein QG669_319 [Patescibacteria group bacterium]|jgi:hypothetical protein|nr:hypothetical protein [Patescibacteria group bacterium]MDQ5961927.1 hypothetical protein [Patescibacteria group bacterium]
MESLESQQKNNERVAKEKIWNESLAKIERITDGLGKPIDKNIKETVVAFVVNGFKTSGSCEGHINHAYPYPYIHIDHWDESPEFLEKRKILQSEIKSKGYNKFEDISEKEIELLGKIAKLKQDFEEHSQKVEKKIKSLIDDFYKSHTPSNPGYMLKAWKGGSFFNICPVSGAGIGLDNKEKFKIKLESMSSEEKELYLKNNQLEMKAFTEFLKNIFFEKEIE